MLMSSADSAAIVAASIIGAAAASAVAYNIAISVHELYQRAAEFVDDHKIALSLLSITAVIGCIIAMLIRCAWRRGATVGQLLSGTFVTARTIQIKCLNEDAPIKAGSAVSFRVTIKDQRGNDFLISENMLSREHGLSLAATVDNEPSTATITTRQDGSHVTVIYTAPTVGTHALRFLWRNQLVREFSMHYIPGALVHMKSRESVSFVSARVRHPATFHIHGFDEYENFCPIPPSAIGRPTAYHATKDTPVISVRPTCSPSDTGINVHIDGVGEPGLYFVSVPVRGLSQRHVSPNNVLTITVLIAWLDDATQHRKTNALQDIESGKSVSLKGQVQSTTQQWERCALVFTKESVTISQPYLLLFQQQLFTSPITEPNLELHCHRNAVQTQEAALSTPVLLKYKAAFQQWEDLVLLTCGNDVTFALRPVDRILLVTLFHSHPHATIAYRSNFSVKFKQLTGLCTQRLCTPIKTITVTRPVPNRSREYIDSVISATTPAWLADDFWLNDWRIRYRGERGIDMGGVAREFFADTLQLLLGPELGLFAPLDPSSSLVHVCNKHNLPTSYYKFTGKLLAKMILQHKLKAFSPVQLSASLRNFLLGNRQSHECLELDDPSMYRSTIKPLLDIRNVSDMMLTFEVSEETPEGLKDVALCPNGANIEVTNDTRVRYLELLTERKLVGKHKSCMESLRSGFFHVLPEREFLACGFNFAELGLILCGTKDFDVTDLCQHAVVVPQGQGHHPSVKVLWDVLQAMSIGDKAKFLQFVTGGPSLPPGGAQHLQPAFKITLKPSSQQLPEAHTCFNELVWPSYTDPSIAHDKLMLAIHTTSFDLA
eukprot:m.51050 g.51050  ORF g.51050 m.51050 type:complete len:830 (+) comp11213_c0_seq4:36-2525(+)